MEIKDIVSLIATNGSPSEISDGIKSALFAKAADKIDSLKPVVASTMFGDSEETYEDNE
jgi:hypothetical protein